MTEVLYTRAPSSPSYIRMGNAKPFYTPAIPKRPPGSFESSPELGRGPSLGEINIDSTTIFAALGGGIAVLAAKSLPEPGPVIAKVLGFGAMGFAVYRAFFEAGDTTAPDAAAPGSPVPGKPTAIADMGAYGKLTGTFLSPASGQRVAPGFLRTAYPIRIMLSNGSAQNVDVIYQVVAKETPEYLYGWSAGQGSPNFGQVAQSQITLKPNEKRPIDLKLDTVTSWPATADYITIELTLQKRRSPETPWQTLSTVTFYYNRSA